MLSVKSNLSYSCFVVPFVICVSGISILTFLFDTDVFKSQSRHTAQNFVDTVNVVSDNRVRFYQYTDETAKTAQQKSINENGTVHKYAAKVVNVISKFIGSSDTKAGCPYNSKSNLAGARPSERDYRHSVKLSESYSVLNNPRRCLYESLQSVGDKLVTAKNLIGCAWSAVIT